jgi:hypothetical protein
MAEIPLTEGPMLTALVMGHTDITQLLISCTEWKYQKPNYGKNLQKCQGLKRQSMRNHSRVKETKVKDN